MKQLIAAALPFPFRVMLTAIRARRHSHALNAEWGVRALSQRLHDTLGGTVQAGPFAGLRVPAAAIPEHLGPYLAGTYERELHPTWARLATMGVPLVVDVGCKVGYYAVGLGRMFGCPTVAYDADPWARRLTAMTAVDNHVAVTVHGLCGRDDFASLPPGALVVMDIEGGEEALLAAPLPAGLDRAVVVVELHEMVRAGLSQAVTAALATTHTIERIPTASPPDPPPCLAFLQERERTLAVNEHRSEQSWVVGWPLRIPGRPEAGQLRMRGR